MVVFLDCFRLKQTHQQHPQWTKHRTQGFYFDEFIRAKPARSSAAVVEPLRRRPSHAAQSSSDSGYNRGHKLDKLREAAPGSKTSFTDDFPHGQRNSFSASPFAKLSIFFPSLLRDHKISLPGSSPWIFSEEVSGEKITGSEFIASHHRGKNTPFVK